jgi:hypothetical protein
VEVYDEGILSSKKLKKCTQSLSNILQTEYRGSRALQVLRLGRSKDILILCYKLLYATAGRNIRLMVWWIEMFCSVIKRKISSQAILSILWSANSCSSVSPLLIFALNSIGLFRNGSCHLEHTMPPVE